MLSPQIQRPYISIWPSRGETQPCLELPLLARTNSQDITHSNLRVPSSDTPTVLRLPLTPVSRSANKHGFVMDRDMGRDASGESGLLLALRRRVWRVLPRFAKRHLYAPLFYHANCFWLAYCAVTTVMETVVIVRASLDGCVSILTPSPEAPRCLPPFFKLYDIITNKGEVAVPTNALVVLARFIFLAVVLLKRVVEARRPVTAEADEARDSSKARLSAVSSQSWQPVTPVSKGLGGLPARIWDMFVISDWSVVASEDVFDEMVSAMRSAVVDLLVLTALKASLNTIPGILSEFGSIGWDWTKSSARTFAYLSAVCGDSPEMTLCHFTYLSRRWLSECTIDMEVIIYTVFMMMPIGVFHQLTFLVGNAKTKYKRFLSILLVWIPLIVCVVQRGIWGYYIYSGLATKVFTGNATKTEIEIFFTTRAVSTGLVLMVLLLLFNVDIIVFKPVRWLGINLGFFSSQQTQPHLVYGLASNDGSERSWSFREVLRHWYAPRGSGLVVRRMMFMFFSYQTFAPSGHAYGYARFWLTWVTRVVFFLMILVQRDGESSFEDLKKDGAGFGLLVDAEDLRRSVKAATQGGRYGRRLRKYKGTMFRMQDTLVVSYRWQSCKTELTDGTSINMSLWQLEQLLDALNNTGCRYAWIDALAIPQDNSALQGLLITRMMAIYSGCRECLILRTVEEEGSRYHQRAW